jgi:hypothetical protein
MAAGRDPEPAGRWPERVAHREGEAAYVLTLGPSPATACQQLPKCASPGSKAAGTGQGLRKALWRLHTGEAEAASTYVK